MSADDEIDTFQRRETLGSHHSHRESNGRSTAGVQGLLGSLIWPGEGGALSLPMTPTTAEDYQPRERQAGEGPRRRGEWEKEEEEEERGVGERGGGGGEGRSSSLASCVFSNKRLENSWEEEDDDEDDDVKEDEGVWCLCAFACLFDVSFVWVCSCMCVCVCVHTWVDACTSPYQLTKDNISTVFPVGNSLKNYI